MSTATDPVVLFKEHRTGARRVAEAILNVPATLNSLSLEMIRLLHPQLEAWAERDDVVALVITAVGDKAFCAGGDIQALYRAIDENLAAGETVNDYPFRFFEEEYRLDYAIHTYPKPVLTLGHGIVMGGGLGIFGASDIRVVTEKSRLAVPEITIGLFPDAGGSWLLKNMPPHYASFLGLTGSHINAADALETGVATHCVAHDDRQGVLTSLLDLPWQEDAAGHLASMRSLLDQVQTPQLPASQITDVPERDPDFASLDHEVAQVRALAGVSEWVDRGIGNLAAGCPTTAGIVVEQLRRVANMTLAESFRMELTVATHCANNRDFHEGVRALLIEKDGAPKWQYGDLAGLDWNHVLGHFEPPWPTHPLDDLDEA